MAYPGRTNPTAVAGIVEVDSATWPDITPFIDAANELVTEVCTGPLYPQQVLSLGQSPRCGVGGYSDVRLELIERWLAAHFYKIADQAVSKEEVGGGGGSVGQSYQFRLGLNFNSTMYGQQVLMLDTRGGFAFLQKRIEKGRKQFTIGVTYLGNNCRRISSWGDCPPPPPGSCNAPCP